ncbi:MAG TPA: MgtC/SapB family protein [Thermomicrobiales bacterium]|nr:MgtC/SapB family protein [Thermomicrobiales bacterium]
MEQLSDLDALGRMAIAMGVGVALGFERELSGKSAGIRTYMLICQGAALFMICALRLSALVDAAGVLSDPSRIASTVVQGIGFLAAGVILTRNQRVQGLTTAAQIWVAAALGLLVGAGFATFAVIATIASIVALVGLRAIEVRFGLDRRLPPGSKTAEAD